MICDQLLNLAEVARRLGGISEKSVRRMIAKGELPQPVRVLRKLLLSESELEAFIERKKLEREAKRA